MNQTIRAFFHKNNVLEVETPALSQFANTDPHIESFSSVTQGEIRYLHTSPEYPMKRLLAADSGDIYQIAKVWRANEVGRYHNSEFTLLEWYRLDFSYQELMQEVAHLLQQLIPSLKNTSNRYLSYQQAFIEILAIDPHISSDKALLHCIQQQNIHIDAELNRSAMLDILMTHCIEPQFCSDTLTFIYDYPVEQSALARVRNESPAVAERFEVYLGKLELGNGYQELQDAQQNATVLQRECDYRQQHKQRCMPQDKKFLLAMQHGLPSCAGVAIGLDRVLMAMLDKKSIQEVISFAWTMA
jgi:lysyl-tRNA synthetase class 2